MMAVDRLPTAIVSPPIAREVLRAETAFALNGRGVLHHLIERGGPPDEDQGEKAQAAYMAFLMPHDATAEFIRDLVVKCAYGFAVHLDEAVAQAMDDHSTRVTETFGGDLLDDDWMDGVARLNEEGAPVSGRRIYASSSAYTAMLRHLSEKDRKSHEKAMRAKKGLSDVEHAYCGDTFLIPTYYGSVGTTVGVAGQSRSFVFHEDAVTLWRGRLLLAEGLDQPPDGVYLTLPYLIRIPHPEQITVVKGC